MILSKDEILFTQAEYVSRNVTSPDLGQPRLKRVLFPPQGALASSGQLIVRHGRDLWFPRTGSRCSVEISLIMGHMRQCARLGFPYHVPDPGDSGFIMQHSISTDLRGRLIREDEAKHMVIKSYWTKPPNCELEKLQHKAESLLQPPRSGNIDALGVGRDLQPSELFLCKLNILVLQALLSLVEHAQVEVHEDTTKQTQNLKANADIHGSIILRLLAREIGIWSPDTGRVTDGVDKGIRGSTLGRRARERISDPGIESAVLGEDEDHQEQGKVARAEAFRRDENDEANDGRNDWIGEEPESNPKFVRNPRMCQTVDDHEYIWRGAQQQRDRLTVTQCCCECREEVLETSCSGDTHVSKGKNIGLDVRHGKLQTLDLTHAALLVHIGFGGINGKTSLGKFAHLWR